MLRFDSFFTLSASLQNANERQKAESVYPFFKDSSQKVLQFIEQRNKKYYISFLLLGVFLLFVFFTNSWLTKSGSILLALFTLLMIWRSRVSITQLKKIKAEKEPMRQLQEWKRFVDSEAKQYSQAALPVWSLLALGLALFMHGFTHTMYLWLAEAAGLGIVVWVIHSSNKKYYQEIMQPAQIEIHKFSECFRD